jgi:hypothetical protein
MTDLVVDLGTSQGLWTFRNNSLWLPFHAASAEQILLADRDGSGKDEIVVDFGSVFGVWEYANDAAWRQLHSLSPETMTSGRFD